MLLAERREVTGAHSQSLPASPSAPLVPIPWSRFRPRLIAAVIIIVLAVVGVSVLLAKNTRSVTATITVGDRPSDVAVSPDGRHAYITNRDSDSVSVIDTECWWIGCWFTG
ncbi:MAG: hypothetical protein ACRDTG_20380 [Pseudonocardiaceae bacterium]